MELNGGTRVLATGAAAALTGGLSVVVYGTFRNDLGRALGGTCLTLTALTVIALILIRQWIVETSEERRLLAVSQREAQAEKSRYFAAQAALEVEQGRLSRDRAAERRADERRLMVERKAIADEFEEQKAALIAETMEATVMMFRDGKRAAVPAQGKLIQLRQPQPQPEQEPQAHPERTRSRGRGVAGP
ncbi:hypothetical protein OHA71_06735 [Streptomyces sp. NBC_00444]|uniref:hypothetical protein n=1 Tax=Streptomyces sp. NBC_00444 TaxID=2975744 RepID=UPI002E22AE0B